MLTGSRCIIAVPKREGVSSHLVHLYYQNDESTSFGSLSPLPRTRKRPSGSSWMALVWKPPRDALGAGPTRQAFARQFQAPPCASTAARFPLQESTPGGPFVG